MKEWRLFLIDNGWRALGHHLAHILGQPESAIDQVRNTRTCKRLRRKLGFVELFSKWHGRSPEDNEWPAPRRVGGGYEWLPNEDALLARLVGTMSVKQLCEALTTRLRLLTGDVQAERRRNHIQCRINRLGLQAGELLGGLRSADAARIVGRVSLVNQAIANGKLKTFRVGHRHVIPQDEFYRWLGERDEPPPGYVRLASLMTPLGISSDSKLAEYASLGYIPTALKVGICTARGTWYIAPEIAKQILDDAAARRPLPWYGKPLPGNQKAMWNKWQARKHRRCRQCQAIWKGRPPSTFEQFCERCTELTLGEKRHLTLDKSQPRKSSAAWRPRGSVKRAMESAGVTVDEAATMLGRRTRWVRGLIRQGLLDPLGVVRDALGGEHIRITPLGIETLRAAAADEDARADTREWVGVHVGAQLAGVSITTVHKWRRLNLVIYKDGPRGILFERESLLTKARQHWTWALQHYKRIEPPAWVRDEQREPAA